MDGGFAGRTIVITGAARGQGAAEAEILVRESARVIGADILDDADEVAELVVFMLSRRASYITGAEIPVDGGHTSNGGTKSIVDALRHAGR